MKIWNTYSSEHSAALVMVGHFNSIKQKNDFLENFEKLVKNVRETIPEFEFIQSFPKEISTALLSGEIKFGEDLSPWDLPDLLLEYSIIDDNVDDQTVCIKSDETGWMAIIKMMVNAGAKVEIFSSHNKENIDA